MQINNPCKSYNLLLPEGLLVFFFNGSDIVNNLEKYVYNVDQLLEK